ncbi:ubiquitin-conjugating enzyme E2-16 kDa [Trichomonascus vanleenenianus]|uniref:ubiquitin-conjugating enzyme E2-16 kDa n=1 Tax=Trichomonascus vanleenenianus TaxID=2268995 RepID=UPI003EC9E38A
MASKRLIKELATFNTDPNPALESLDLENEDNLFAWIAVLKGPQDTPYEGGKWKIRIKVPATYPLQPPEMHFLTKICHPNIHFDTGEVCLDVLKSQWTPAWTLSSALTAVQAMLSDPEPNSPLNIDAANLVRCGDHSAYQGLIRYYTVLYASSQP